MGTTSIHLCNIEKTYFTPGKTVEVLQGINLDIEEGEFFVLLGPSGCGKSTLLNLLAGLEKPTRGEIKFGEDVVASVAANIMLPPFERNVAMVFQSYALYPHMTIRENLAFPLTNLSNKPSKKEIKARVSDVAGKLRIDKLLDRKPAQLSGGERQRVAIGRAIIREPRVFLMDEPLSNLDAELRMNMHIELKGLQREKGVTTVYVTHDQLEAIALGDRIAILDAQGNLQQQGAPLEVYDHPANIFVAKFIGSPPMNIFEGELINTTLKTPAIDISLPYELLELLAGRRQARGVAKLTIGVRPEHFTIKSKGQGNFDVTIDVVEHLGSENLWYASLRNGEQIVIKTNKELDEKEIGLELNPEKTHLFD